MGSGAAVCSDDVNSISRASHRISRALRNHTAALHGARGNLDGEKKSLGLPLLRIRTLERHNNILGM